MKADVGWGERGMEGVPEVYFFSMHSHLNVKARLEYTEFH
jgi:hypothetical protein